MKLVNNQYMLELDDVLQNSEFEEVDLTEVYGDKMPYHLKSISRKVYSIMYNAYRGTSRDRQRKWLNWYIQQDTDRVEVMRDAMIEYLRGSLTTGMELLDYEPSSSIEERKANVTTYPPLVRDILRENGLWILSTVQYQDEEIE